MASYSYPTNNLVLQVAANSISANSTGSTAQPADIGLTALPTGSAVVIRDSNGNFSANLVGQKRTTSFATTTLTSTSAYYQTITNAGDSSVVLPDVTTLPKLGFGFLINATSSGNITITSSGGEVIYVITGSGAVLVTCISLTGTGASSWFSAIMIGKAVTAATASNLMLYDSSGNVQLLNAVISQEDIASQNGTVTLSNSNAGIQLITGTTAGTVVKLPDTSTLSSSPPDCWKLINTSTKLVTIQSYGGTTLLILPPNAQGFFTCLSTIANDATAWNVSYSQPNNVGSLTKYSASATVISSTPTVVVWTTANYTDAFTYASGVFTARWGGTFKIVVSLAVTATFSTNNTVVIEILKNGTTIAQRTYYTIASITDVMTQCKTVAQLVATDTISIRVSTTGTTPTIVNSNSRNDVTLISV